MSMKNILNEWRSFLKEGVGTTGGQVKAQGIVKANLSDISFIKQKQSEIKLGDEYHPISDDKLHITMLHQNVGKQLKKNGVAYDGLSGGKISKEIQKYDFGSVVDVSFDEKLYVAEADGKKSVFIKCDASTQTMLTDYIKKRFVENYNSVHPDATISEADFEKARSEIEKGAREFHVSLANNGVPDEQGFAKTGDSVALVHVATVTEYTPGKDDEV